MPGKSHVPEVLKVLDTLVNTANDNLVHRLSVLGSNLLQVTKLPVTSYFFSNL